MAMTCEGCSAAAKKVMGKLTGVSKVETDVEKKLVYVTSTLPPDQLLEQLKKTGKEVAYNGIKGTRTGSNMDTAGGIERILEK
ncbi:copper transport protein ATX1 [Elysia marginata]|uniref:Copper transport protein ATOX1 n=1 Tax=Elysia marginata TaxID=1093978 RepID=A0AAV4I343_9GAST|nr:copper transport protein ATX1 [Elysia marginata]